MIDPQRQVVEKWMLMNKEMITHNNQEAKVDLGNQVSKPHVVKVRDLVVGKVMIKEVEVRKAGVDHNLKDQCHKEGAKVGLKGDLEVRVMLDVQDQILDGIEEEREGVVPQEDHDQDLAGVIVGIEEEVVIVEIEGVVIAVIEGGVILLEEDQETIEDLQVL